MTSQRTRALFVASWALGGCNVLVGLDDVNIVQDGSGGAGAGPAADGTGAATSTAGAGDSPGTGAQGGGAATGPIGGARGDETSTSTSGSGGMPASTSGGGEMSTAGSGGGTAGSGGGTSTAGSGGSAGGSGGGGGMPPADPCGDGVLGDGEQCDDGGAAPGDGCSGACQVEPFHQCTTPGPSLCSKQEVLCADGADGDGDGLVDGMDLDCWVPAYAPAVACNAVRIYRSVNAPLAIPEKGGGEILSPIVVDGGLNVAHTAVLLDISHGHAGDLHVALLPPFGPPRTLTSDNGGTGADYDTTLFDGACPGSVTAGSPPFHGCYKPESSLPGSGQPAAGVWTLAVIDQANGQTGVLEGWTLILCAE